jgi:hypothetical protein
MEEKAVSHALGGLTEAVNGLRRDVQEFKLQRSELSKRVGALENFKAWTKGAGGALGIAVATLGLDRLSLIFLHRG